MRRVTILCIAAAALAGAAWPRGAAAEPAVSDRLTFRQPGSGIARVEVSYPNAPGLCPSKQSKKLVARYRGTLEIAQLANGGLAVIDSLTFDEYLRGLSEVPRSWPDQALEAQVIAARSYALYQLQNRRPSGRAIGYDICSTDQCQVYRGVAIEQGAFGEKWVAAVRNTGGLALVSGGQPIQAFYFSTSSGRTRSNKEVFGGSPLPYFKPVDGEDDDAPLARWSVRVPFADLTRVLREDAIAVPTGLQTVERRGDTIVLTGSSGRTQTTATAVRRALNSEGPCLMPDRYPQRRADGSKLPQSLPSVRYSVAASGGAAVFTGRGWGHDVGMSQWGAKSLAGRGRSASDILAHYYGGLRPQRVEEPGAIKVLVADGGISVRITPEGGGTLTTANGGQIGQGPSYVITPGTAGPMRVERTTPQGAQPVLQITEGSTTRSNGSVERVFTLSAPARVGATVSRDGAPVATQEETSFERGEQRLTVPLGSEKPPPGTYEIVLEAFDGVDRVRLASSVIVASPSAPAPASPGPGGGGASAGLIVVAGGAAAILAGLLLLVRARRKRQPNVNV